MDIRVDSSFPVHHLPNSSKCFHPVALFHDTTSSATDVRNFLVGEILDIHVLFCMFDSHTDELPISIEFNQNILVDVSCLDNFFMSEIY